MDMEVDMNIALVHGWKGLDIYNAWKKSVSIVNLTLMLYPATCVL